MPTPKPNKGGRPFIQVVDTREKKTPTIDLRELRPLAWAGCTEPEIAAYFGITDRTLRNLAKRNKELKAVMATSALAGKASLRRELRKRAMSGKDDKGSHPCLIFSCKNELGMRDRVANEHSGPDGKPIEIADKTQGDVELIDALMRRIQQAKVESGSGPIDRSGEDSSSESAEPAIAA